MKIEYLSDIQDLIRANLASKNEKLAAHARTLIVPRTHGSTTKKSIMEGFGYISVYRLGDQSNVMGGAVAYGFKDDMSIGGFLGAISLENAKNIGLEIEAREGVHGPELHAKINRELRMPVIPTDEFTVIIGEFEGEQAVFTWHPGAPLSPGVDINNPMTAVKLLPLRISQRNTHE